jgi:hypothetical protein
MDRAEDRRASRELNMGKADALWLGFVYRRLGIAY